MRDLVLAWVWCWVLADLVWEGGSACCLCRAAAPGSRVFSYACALKRRFFTGWRLHAPQRHWRKIYLWGEVPR